VRAVHSQESLHRTVHGSARDADVIDARGGVVSRVDSHGEVVYVGEVGSDLSGSYPGDRTATGDPGWVQKLLGSWRRRLLGLRGRCCQVHVGAGVGGLHGRRALAGGAGRGAVSARFRFEERIEKRAA